MEFTATHLCPKYPTHLEHVKPRNPWPGNSDTSVDTMMQLLVDRGIRPSYLPKTQYGRRVLCSHYEELVRKQIAKEEARDSERFAA